jgi:peptidyl-prolyl cis-trans isomerase SurA
MVSAAATRAENRSSFITQVAAVNAMAWPLRALGALSFLACMGTATPAFAQAVEGVAAIVNDEVISTYDVRQRMRLILATTGVRPTEELLLRVQEQALNSLIDERLQMQQAREFEVEIDQAEVDDAMADLARQNDISPEEIRTSLLDAGVDARTLEDQLRADIAWQILVSGRYMQRVRVSNDQIDQTLERYAESSAKPQFLISEILIAPNFNEGEAELSVRVEAVQSQLYQGASFVAVARQASAAASAIDGGDVGWVRSGDIKPEIESQLLTMETGTLSPPIQTLDGVYLIALRDRRSGADPERVSLNQVLAPINGEATSQIYEEVERTLSRALRGVRGCTDLARVAGDGSSILVSDLGTIAPSDLAPDFRRVVDSMSPGDISEPIRTPAGVVHVALCARDRTGGADLPTRDQIEARLMEQQLSQASRRWLRDLRRDATIETRVGP